MSRVYVGNLDPRVTERELEDEFRVYGVLRNVWVARKPPGFGFVEFESAHDAKEAIHAMDGKNEWRVQLSRSSRGGGAVSRGQVGNNTNCHGCGELGHFARDCRWQMDTGGFGTGGGGPSRNWRPGYPQGVDAPRRRHSSSHPRISAGHRRSPRYPRSPPAGRRSRSPAARRRSESRAIAPRRESSDRSSSSPPPRRNRCN